MRASARPAYGFTVIELAVTLVVGALLAQFVVNGMSTWMLSARIRTAADAIQTGLRQAQAEALKQNRVVAFALSPSKAYGSTMPAPATSGSYWYTATVPWTTYTAAGVSNAQSLVAAGEISPDMSQIRISGAADVCFSPYGRPTATYTIPSGAVTSSGAAATITSCATTSTTYAVTASNGDTSHNLNVVVSSGGQIRMCNPNKTLSSSAPDGC